MVVSAGQLAPLLGGLRPAGNLRDVHPSDAVRLWLDARTAVPLQLQVVAGTGADRRRWAAGRGYTDEAGTVVLDVRLAAVRYNAPVADGAFPAAPPEALTTGGGFSAAAESTTPAGLPEGFTPWRSGTTTVAGSPPVDVASWSDGRAWVKVRSTSGWVGPGLFGGLGGVVRPLRLGAAGIAYASEDGSKLALRAAGRDVVVLGSAAPSVLRSVAASLGVVGTRVPDSWPEASSTSVSQAAAQGLDPLVLPPGRGFGPPGVRVDGATVTVSYTGPGERGFVLVISPGARLSPPLDPDVRGTQVRGVVGRYSPGRGVVEWVEGTRLLSMASRTLSGAELADLAGGLGPP